MNDPYAQLRRLGYPTPSGQVALDPLGSPLYGQGPVSGAAMGGVAGNYGQVPGPYAPYGGQGQGPITPDALGGVGYAQPQQYSLPPDPAPPQYSLPSGDGIGPWGDKSPGDYIDGIGIKGLGGAVGIKQEALDDGWFHDSAGDHDVRSQ